METSTPRQCSGPSRSMGKFFAEGIHRLTRQEDACPSDMGLFYGVYSFVHNNTASLIEPRLMRYYFRDYFRLLTAHGAHTASFLKTLSQTIRQIYISLTFSQRKSVKYNCGKHYHPNRLLQCTQCTIKMQLNHNRCQRVLQSPVAFFSKTSRRSASIY
jgi:hypothetical protein